MKKKLAFLLTCLLSLAMFSGCSTTPNSGFSGTYWLENHSASNVQKDFYEKIEYNVSFIEEDDLAPKLYELNDDYLNFIIDEEKSSYVTELYSEGDLYVYKTKLVINGAYTFGEFTYSVEDDVTETITKFKGMENGFACVESTKSVKNVYPAKQAPINEDDFVTLTADFKIVYGEKSATLTVDAKDSVSKSLLVSVQEPVTVKNYNKKAYIDNDLMLLIFRNFNYDDSLNYTFKTIDSATGALREISGAKRVDQTSTASLAVRSFEIASYVDTVSNNRMNIKFNCFGISFKTMGEYSQSFCHAYYAKSVEGAMISGENVARHYMVKCYRPAIYNIGYMVYTIDTVTHQR